MFGLTKREQRWKAAETLMPLLTAVATEALRQDDEKAQLRRENEELRGAMQVGVRENAELRTSLVLLRQEAGKACAMLHRAMALDRVCDCEAYTIHAAAHHEQCFYRLLSEQSDRLEALLK